MDDYSDYETMYHQTVAERVRLRQINAELVAALERVIKVAGEYNPKFPMGAGYYAEFAISIADARAALAKAKE